MAIALQLKVEEYENPLVDASGFFLNYFLMKVIQMPIKNKPWACFGR